MDATFYYVTIEGRQACQTRSANSIITPDGIDFHTSKPAAFEYQQLLHLPHGTEYHELKRSYQLPGGTKLTTQDVKAAFQAKAAENAKPKPVDPFDPFDL